jgi:thymidine phosphorylase
VLASAGVLCLVKPGEPVTKGQPVLELHTDDPARLERAREALRGALEVTPEAPGVALGPPLVIERIG